MVRDRLPLRTPRGVALAERIPTALFPMQLVAVLLTSSLYAAVALAVPPGAGAKSRAQHCGRVPVHVRHASAKVLIVRGPGACIVAQELIADAFTAETKRHYDFLDPTYGVGWRVDGWRCTTGLAGSQTFCTRDHDRTDGSFRSDDGWNF